MAQDICEKCGRSSEVYILLGSDDYFSRKILAVYSSRELAEADINNEKHLLISRQGEPKREIVMMEVQL